jgi:hypothetical protein
MFIGIDVAKERLDVWMCIAVPSYETKNHG